jgi:hypothetical protein
MGIKGRRKAPSYYFEAKNLFAIRENGKMTNLDEKARAMGEKLQCESKAFLRAAK